MDGIKTIYVVFKTHFDIGYTELASEIIERYGRKMLPDVIKTCLGTQALGRDHRFVWTMSAWPLVQSLSPEHAVPEDIEAARELLREGQIAWHLLPYTTHTEFCGLEEYIRGFCFSRALSLEYGFWPVSAKMTDVPGHTWILPALLNKAGVKFLHLGCNPCCMPPDVPRLFFWEGPDGSRVLTFYNKGHYGSSLLPPEDWPFPVWLALMQTNDNIGPQGPDAIENILGKINEELPDANVIVGTMDDFYHALSKVPLDDVPVVRGDLADTWIHGVGTYPGEVPVLRRVRLAAAEAEKALSVEELLGCIGGEARESMREAFSRLFELTLLFGEHTWGLDVKSTLHNRVYRKWEFLARKQDDETLRIEQSWNEQRERATGAQRLLDTTLPLILDTLAANISVSGRRLVAFNGIGWKRGAWVDVSALQPKGDETVVDAQTGEAVSVSEGFGGMLAYVPNLPAFGWKTLVLGKAVAPLLPPVAVDAGQGILENKWFRIQVDAGTGTVRSLLEKETGREWIDMSAGYGLGQYRYDVYGQDDVTEFIRSYAYRFSDWLVADLGRLDYPEIGHGTWFAKGFSITAESDARGASLVLTATVSGKSIEEFGNAETVEARITLYSNEPYVDVAIRLIGKRETPYVEAGHIVMPFNMKNHSVSVNKLGSVVNPETDIVRDANHGLYCCENWVDLTDGEAGMAVVPYDMPLFSLGEPSIYQYQRQSSPKPPMLCFNLFNNSWGTNFPQWMGGDFRFRYRLIPHRGDWREGSVQRMALESMTPVLTGTSDQSGGTLPVAQSLLAIPDGMAAVALKPGYDGGGHVLRLREIEGRERTDEFAVSMPGCDARECDLLERELGKPDKAIKPFDIRSLKIQRTVNILKAETVEKDE